MRGGEAGNNVRNERSVVKIGQVGGQCYAGKVEGEGIRCKEGKAEAAEE